MIPKEDHTKLHQDRLCEYCKKPFNCGTHRRQKYCENKCNQAAYVFRKTGRRRLALAEIERLFLFIAYGNDLHKIQVKPFQGLTRNIKAYSRYLNSAFKSIFLSALTDKTPTRFKAIKATFKTFDLLSTPNNFIFYLLKNFLNLLKPRMILSA